MLKHRATQQSLMPELAARESLPYLLRRHGHLLAPTIGEGDCPASRLSTEARSP